MKIASFFKFPFPFFLFLFFSSFKPDPTGHPMPTLMWKVRKNKKESERSLSWSAPVRKTQTNKQTNKQKSIVLLLRFSTWDKKKKEIAKKSFFCRLLAEVSMSWFLWGCECNYEIPVVLRCEILWARQVYQEKGGVPYWIGRVTRLFSYYIIKKKNNDKIKELRTTTLSIFSKQPMLDLLVLSRFQWGTLFVA